MRNSIVAYIVSTRLVLNTRNNALKYFCRFLVCTVALWNDVNARRVLPNVVDNLMYELGELVNGVDRASCGLTVENILIIPLSVIIVAQEC